LPYTANYNFGVSSFIFRWGALFLCAGIVPGQVENSIDFIYTEAPRYEPATPGTRFPAGAALRIVAQGQARALVPAFAASADASIAFDGQRVLFAGKRKAGDPWQIWEVPAAGGAPRRVTAFNDDAVAPFYLADEWIVYSRHTPSGFQLETMPLAGGGPVVRLTYAPGDHLATDALRDGRVLFDGPHPDAASPRRDVYAVYPDGSGVETYRCDHGRDRHSGRQVASGDIVFEVSGKLARFTSARADQLEIPMSAGQFAGPIAETPPGEWLVAYRPDSRARYGIYRWKAGQSAPDKLVASPVANAIQPVLVAPHEVPKRHPSGLGNREGANLLCLNAYTSRSPIPADSVAAVRVWALDDAGAAVNLGQAPVEHDGSFFVQTPADRGIRFELLDQAGKTVAAEKGWFWARRGEQRICVGCHAGPERAPDNAVPAILLRGTDPAKMLLPVHGRETAEVRSR
jgi:hypothetical protein